MDQLCVELPPGHHVVVGDAVTLVGQVGGEAIATSQVAEAIGATPHEFTTCLTGRTPRFARGG